MFKIILPSIKLKVERWKYNEEYKVYVSSLGRFKNENKKDIKLLIGSNGYCMVNTWKGLKAAHRLVLMTYKPVESMDNLTVDHLNHNKRNNELSNLEWVSKQVNQARAQADFIILEDKTLENAKYQCGKWIFESLDEAIGFVIGNANRFDKHSNPNRENIRAKILTAVARKKDYCGFKWTCIKKEKELC